MARRGVWELRELFIKYSLDGGSSRGVREFIEEGLIGFAKKNPQINIATKLEPGHPNVHAKYITGYEKNLALKNLTKDDVEARVQYLRNSLGCKTPPHNRLWKVERDFVSVQGFWRNTPELRIPALPEEIELRQRRQQEHGLRKVIDEVGVNGIALVLKKLDERQIAAKAEALAKQPKVERVMPTE
eukprot:IDg17577t1